MSLSDVNVEFWEHNRHSILCPTCLAMVHLHQPNQNSPMWTQKLISVNSSTQFYTSHLVLVVRLD